MTDTIAPIPDGYYWAKKKARPSEGWKIVEVSTSPTCGEQGVSMIGWAGFVCTSNFTFGPRIEEPAEMHGDTIIGNFADWQCPSCRAESWDTAYVIANETRLHCTCGVQVKVTYPLNTPSAAAPADRQ